MTALTDRPDRSAAGTKPGRRRSSGAASAASAAPAVPHQPDERQPDEAGRSTPPAGPVGLEADVPAPPLPTTEAQRERYTRILDTTLRILDESGPHGVQVREVSRRADVALATLYRYFPSRDFLIAMALDHWSSGLAARLQRRRSRTAVEGDVRSDLSAAMASVAGAFANHPQYAAAAVLAAGSSDPLVAGALLTYRTSFAAGLDAVLGGIPEPQRSDVAFVVESVLIGQLVGFSSGRRTPADMTAALERAISIIDLGEHA